jgi:hypothetical protein
MAISVSGKLKIREKNKLLTLNAPADFKKKLEGLPAGVTISSTGKEYDQVHWFVLNKAQLAKELGKVLKLFKENVLIWIYYPKGTSKLQTDLNRDSGWETLMKHNDKFTWVNLISFDETWSAFGLRGKTAADKKKESKPKPGREIFKYINPATKEIRLPDDLASALKKNKKEAAFFDTLSFTNKKEYVEWIVTAKREETRMERVDGTIERLKKKWKNPRNI